MPRHYATVESFDDRGLALLQCGSCSWWLQIAIGSDVIYSSWNPLFGIHIARSNIMYCPKCANMMASWAPRAPPGGWHNASLAWYWWCDQPTNVRVFSRGVLTTSWHAVTHVDVPASGFTMPTINEAVMREAIQLYVPPPPTTVHPTAEVTTDAEEDEFIPPSPPSGPDEEIIPPPPPYPPADWRPPV